MGKVIINQTDQKQRIELVTSADGVTGGYYDAAGVWHEFGGGESEFVSVTISATETSTGDIEVRQVLTEITDEFQSVDNAYIQPGESLNLRVLKNALAVELYEGETDWLRFVSGTGKTIDLGSDGVYVYFDEDGQTAILDYNAG